MFLLVSVFFYKQGSSSVGRDYTRVVGVVWFIYMCGRKEAKKRAGREEGRKKKKKRKSGKMIR